MGGVKLVNVVDITSGCSQPTVFISLVSMILGEVFMSEASKVEEVKSLMLQRSRLTLRIEKMNVEYREFNKSLKVLRYEIDVIDKRLAVLNGVG